MWLCWDLTYRVSRPIYSLVFLFRFSTTFTNFFQVLPKFRIVFKPISSGTRHQFSIIWNVYESTRMTLVSLIGSWKACQILKCWNWSSKCLISTVAKIVPSKPCESTSRLTSPTSITSWSVASSVVFDLMFRYSLGESWTWFPESVRYFSIAVPVPGEQAKELIERFNFTVLRVCCDSTPYPPSIGLTRRCRIVNYHVTRFEAFARARTMPCQLLVKDMSDGAMYSNGKRVYCSSLFHRKFLTKDGEDVAWSAAEWLRCRFPSTFCIISFLEK